MDADGYEKLIYIENMQWDNVEKLISVAINSNLNRGELYVLDTKYKRIQEL